VSSVCAALQCAPTDGSRCYCRPTDVAMFDYIKSFETLPGTGQLHQQLTVEMD